MLAGPKPRSARNVGLVRHLALAAVHLHDAVAAHALPEVLVRGHDAHLVDGVGVQARAGGQRVVGLVLAHRPDDDAQRAHRLLDEVELRVQLGRDALVALVPGEQIVAERADRVVERDRQVGHVFAGVVQQREQRRDDAGGRLRVRPVGRGVTRTAARSARDTARRCRRPGAGACRLRHARSNSKTSDASPPTISSAPAPLTAAASPAASFSLPSATAPRATCSHAWRDGRRS